MLTLTVSLNHRFIYPYLVFEVNWPFINKWCVQYAKSYEGTQLAVYDKQINSLSVHMFSNTVQKYRKRSFLQQGYKARSKTSIPL